MSKIRCGANLRHVEHNVNIDSVFRGEILVNEVLDELRLRQKIPADCESDDESKYEVHGVTFSCLGEVEDEDSPSCGRFLLLPCAA